MTDWQACGQQLARGMKALAQSHSPAVQRQLIGYLQELNHWNRRHNLTAIRDPEAMVTRHLLDCLTVLPFISAGRVADIGTGPGLPGLVLAVTRPELSMTLVESNRKKVTFLRHARRQLALANVDIVHQKAQDYQPDVPFDTLVTRALARADETADATCHLLNTAGALVLMKGRDPAAEMTQLPVTMLHERTQPVSVPGLQAERHIAVLRRCPDH